MNTIRQKLGNSLSTSFGPLLALILLVVVLSCISGRFLRYDNTMNVLRQSSINALVALGMLFVLLTGGIDLSVGSTIAVSACVMGALMKKGVGNPVVLVAAGLVCGLVVGVLNGLLFTKAKLPHPFVSTLGMMMILRGFALVITGARPIVGFPPSVYWLGKANVMGVPACFILVLAVGAVASVILNHTALGQQIYAVGGNKEAARLAGIDVDRTINVVYIFSSFMAALAGIVLLGRISTAYALSGDKYEMDAIAACVIGGASFNGGVGTVSGTLIGALLIGVLRNDLNLLGAQSDVTQMVIGAVIILAVFIDVMRGRTAYNIGRHEQARAMAAEEARHAAE
ncbi:MAG: ABC transporter permease [Planctomycetaceae bacterium]|nr:ABC transporter permease [Planctomycetaceae bacterium]